MKPSELRLNDKVYRVYYKGDYLYEIVTLKIMNLKANNSEADVISIELDSCYEITVLDKANESISSDFFARDNKDVCGFFISLEKAKQYMLHKLNESIDSLLKSLLEVTTAKSKI